MRLQVLHVPDCPNAVALTTRLALLLGGHDRIEQQVIHDQDEAAAAGMSGSPTLLLDGIDPFAAVAGRPPGLSCRLYLDENGALAGAPSLVQLRAAITWKGPGNA
jgi:hypothetical protein